MDPMNPSTDQPPAGVPAPGAVAPATGTPPPVWSMPPSPIAMPSVVAATPLAPARRRRDPLTILMVVAAFVALGGVGFAVGRVTAPTAAAATAGRGGFGNGSFNNPGGGSFTTGGNGATGLGRGDRRPHHPEVGQRLHPDHSGRQLHDLPSAGQRDVR